MSNGIGAYIAGKAEQSATLIRGNDIPERLRELVLMALSPKHPDRSKVIAEAFDRGFHTPCQIDVIRLPRSPGRWRA